jgi:hypothetical protein
MSYERPGMGPEAVPAGASGRAAEADAAGIPASMRLQILSTEHWSLLASRSLAWNESFSRAGMFLTTLSGALVALALIAQATDFGDGFALSALVILPVVLFIGIATVVRLGDSNYHDAVCVVGMNRIRHAYLELAPDLAPYFVMGVTDDVRGVGLTMGVPERQATLLHVLAATPAVIGVVCAVLAAVIVALVAIELHAGTAATLAAGVATFLFAMALFARSGRRAIGRGQASLRPLFPTPPDD